MELTRQNLQRTNRVRAVEAALVEVENDANLELDMNKFWLQISNMYGCSERKAKEYIKIAQANLSKAKDENGTE